MAQELISVPKIDVLVSIAVKAKLINGWQHQFPVLGDSCGAVNADQDVRQRRREATLFPAYSDANVMLIHHSCMSRTFPARGVYHLHVTTLVLPRIKCRIEGLVFCPVAVSPPPVIIWRVGNEYLGETSALLHARLRQHIPVSVVAIS